MQFPEPEDFAKARRTNNGIASTIIGRRIIANPGLTFDNIRMIEYADVWLRGLTAAAKPIPSTEIIESPSILLINKRTNKPLWSNLASSNNLGSEYLDFVSIDNFSPGLYKTSKYYVRKVTELSEIIQREQIVDIQILNPNSNPVIINLALYSYFIYEE